MILRKTVVLILLLAAIIWSACGTKDKETEVASYKESEGEESGGPALDVDVAAGAVVTGKVTFAGAKPATFPIRMDAEPVCARIHGGPVASQDVTLNDNGTLRYVLIYVKDGLGGKSYKPIQPRVILDQHGCLYDPHVLGIVAGQELDITNTDDTTHNIHPLPKVNREWNESQAKGDPKKKVFTQAEMPPIPIKCNIHPWMRSYLAVFKHPFFAVTSKDGTFEIKGLPPGSYTIEAWHEKLGTQEMKVNVSAKESKAVDFSFKG